MLSQSYYPHKYSHESQYKSYGLIHVNFGQGVGKTSRCIGLAIRAAGTGLNVTWVQFMKSDDSSETKILRYIPSISYYCPGKHPFILSNGPQNIHYEHAKNAFQLAKKMIKKNTTILICDEILNTIIFGILTESHLLKLIDTCRGKTELIMSGIDATPKIIASADYVTEFIQHKHPYYKGQLSRQGIEY